MTDSGQAGTRPARSRFAIVNMRIPQAAGSSAAQEIRPDGIYGSDMVIHEDLILNDDGDLESTVFDEIRQALAAQIAFEMHRG